MVVSFKDLSTGSKVFVVLTWILLGYFALAFTIGFILGYLGVIC